MFNVSNYYQQSKGLPAQNDFQIILLKLTDLSTRLREASKCGTVIGLVVSASSWFFNFNPTTALTCTSISGVSWLLSRTCAQKLEPHAEEMIKFFKELKEESNVVAPKDACLFGLVESNET